MAPFFSFLKCLKNSKDGAGFFFKILIMFPFINIIQLCRTQVGLWQGRSDGVSRVSNAYGPTAEGGPPRMKIHTRFFQNQENHKFRTFCLWAHETLATALVFGPQFNFFPIFWAISVRN